MTAANTPPSSTPASSTPASSTPVPHPHAPRSGELDPRLLEVLVCPVTHGALEYDRAAAELISRAAGLAYPIRDGVPVMLPEEARALGG